MDMRPTGPVVSFVDEHGRPISVGVDHPLPVGGGGGGGGGMRFLAGSGAPSASDGMPGDVYLDTDTGDLYRNSNGSWDLLMSLIGPAGADGAQGPQGPQGPAGATGPAGADAELTPAVPVDPDSETFAADLVAALQAVGLMEGP